MDSRQKRTSPGDHGMSVLCESQTSRARPQQSQRPRSEQSSRSAFEEGHAQNNTDMRIRRALSRPHRPIDVVELRSFQHGGIRNATAARRGARLRL